MSKSIKNSRSTSSGFVARNIKALFVLVVITWLSSCSPAKMVPDGEYWLSDTYVDLECIPPTQVQEDLDLLIKQRGNSKTFGLRSIRLDIYNWMGGSEKPIEGKWFKRQRIRFTNWVAEVIGNEPVIYSRIQQRRSAEMMVEYMKSKGYYNAVVNDTVVFSPIGKSNDQKATVIYRVKPNIPYKVKSFIYEIDDYFMQGFIMRDTANAKVRSGDYFDASKLQEERMRLTDSLRNRGYYKFAKEYIFYEVDSNLTSYQVDIRLKIKPYAEKIKGKEVTFPYHPVYSIRKVYVYPNYDPKRAIDEGPAYFSRLEGHDTLGVTFLHESKEKMKYRPVLRGVSVKKLELYKLKKAESTAEYLNGLSAVKVVNVAYTEPDDPKFVQQYMGLRPLDCHIYLTTATSQSYTIEAEGSYASKEYYAVNANLIYRHKNLFRGSEDFNLSFNNSWAYNESLFETDNTTSSASFNSVKYGVDARLTIPRFLLPFGFQKFNRRYNPKTNYSLGFSYERRPDFNMQSTLASWGYIWKTSDKLTHYLNPVDLTATEILSISEAYQGELSKKNLLADYSDKIISATNYTMVYNGKPDLFNPNFSYFRTRIEAAGNTFSLINSFGTSEKIDNEYLSYPAYHIFGLPYAQYLLAEGEYRYNFVMDERRKLVIRAFAGAGLPYGNFQSMPIQKQYMSGGLNSLRGWLPGHIGPGNFPVEKASTSSLIEYLNFQQRAELKLEFNAEYRFKINSMLEGALFFDMGNIWTLSEYNLSYLNAQTINENLSEFGLTDKIETRFLPGSFYKQFAYNTGIGARFDFSFFVFRLDVGTKIYDPGNPDVGLFRSGLLDLDVWHLNFGVGYPF